MSLVGKDFKSRGGSSPLIRFTLGAFMTIGALIFLGCPFRMILRLANGDLNALVALSGFIVGIARSLLLKRGQPWKKLQANKDSRIHIPASSRWRLVFAFIVPEFIKRSAEGPGSMSAPIIASLVGSCCWSHLRTRLCSGSSLLGMLL